MTTNYAILLHGDEDHWDAVAPEDNATGTRMALTKLAAYVEGAGGRPA